MGLYVEKTINTDGSLYQTVKFTFNDIISELNKANIEFTPYTTDNVDESKFYGRITIKSSGLALVINNTEGDKIYCRMTMRYCNGEKSGYWGKGVDFNNQKKIFYTLVVSKESLFFGYLKYNGNYMGNANYDEIQARSNIFGENNIKNTIALETYNNSSIRRLTLDRYNYLDDADSWVGQKNFSYPSSPDISKLILQKLVLDIAFEVVDVYASNQYINGYFEYEGHRYYGLGSLVIMID